MEGFDYTTGFRYHLNMRILILIIQLIAVVVVSDQGSHSVSDTFIKASPYVLIILIGYFLAEKIFKRN